jgi:hypothetical protein
LDVGLADEFRDGNVPTGSGNGGFDRERGGIAEKARKILLSRRLGTLRARAGGTTDVRAIAQAISAR